MNKHTKKSMKILGLGSPFGDDQLAQKVCALLKKRLPQFDICYHDRPGIRLLEHIKETNKLILIDAVLSNHAIATLHRLEDHEIENFPTRLSSHHIGLAETLKLGRALHCLPEKIVFYGLEADPKNQQTELSPALAAKIPELINHIIQETQRLLKKDACN